MPLNLHAGAISQVRQKLIAYLPEVIVENQMFIQRRSALSIITADFSLPRTEKLHDSLVEYIDEFPFLEFILNTLGKELWELDRWELDANPKINELAEFADLEAVGTRLVNDFNSLPWTYLITVPLPEVLTSILRPNSEFIEITPTIRIARVTEAFKKEFPLATANKVRDRRIKGSPFGLFAMMMEETPAEWNAATLHLQIKLDGFVDMYGTTGTALQAERNVRSILGMGIANRLLDCDLRYTPNPVKAHAYVHQQQADGSWAAQTRYDLSDSVSRGIAGLKPCVLDFLDTDEKRNGWNYWRIKEIGTVIQAGLAADQTVLAGQWFFDSYCGQDQLLSFIQSMVVLEILFGDKKVSDEIGIGELISNRFAYLIGTTYEERSELIDAIRKIYKIRSQIVHSGKHRLSLEENGLFSRLRWMCRRAIDKEIDLIKASVEAKKKAIEDRSGA